MESPPLAGRTIAVPETRELEVFAAMLERRGARVLRCPLVAIRDAPDPAPVLAFARAFAQEAFDDLVLTTGEGLRRILGCIERHEPELRAAFLAALGRVRKITRGPKPARALRELGMKPDIAAARPTTEGIIASLTGLDLKGRRVGVQLYGTEPNRPLTEFLERAGAVVSTVAPAARVRAALERTLVAAVGPVVADALSRHGVSARLMPEESFFLKPLTSALEEALRART